MLNLSSKKSQEQAALAANFSAALRESGVAPKVIAERCGVSVQAISGWKKTGKIDRLHLLPIAELTGWSVERLLGKAEAGHFASEALAHYDSSGAKKIRRVAVVGTAKLGDDGYFEDFSWVPGAGDGHIEIETDDPNAYCLRVRGMSMHPAIRDGWYVLVEPGGTPQEGEYVLVKLRSGKKMVKEFLFRRNDAIQVMSVNGADRFAISYADIEDVHSVGAVLPPSKWRPD